MVIDLNYNGSDVRTGIRASNDTNTQKFELVPLLDDTDGANFKIFKNSLSVGRELEIEDEIDLSSLPYANVTTHSVDSLAPMIGFMYNPDGSSSPNANALGTREFEIRYNTVPITFDAKDDVPGQTGIDAGYYEIIHTTEGSDGLIIPTTSEQGMVPYGEEFPSFSNSKVQIFNVCLDDPQGTFKTMAQAELETEAKAEIVRILADQNHYTANANPIVFEEHKPDLVLGRRVAFDDAAGYRINTRIIKLVTKLDYNFETEITFGNKLPKRFSDRVMSEIAKLGNGTGGYESIDITPDAQRVTIVEYAQWIQGGSYFFETINKKTGVLETSHVWHKGCLWECRRTLTAEEPWFTSSDWVCLRANNISLGFYSNTNPPVPITGLSVRPQRVDETIKPYLLIGQEDISSTVTSWKWERETYYTALDDVWKNSMHTNPEDMDPENTSPLKSNTRVLHITNADLPTGWDTDGHRVAFKCTATFPYNDDNAEIMNQITIL